MEYKDPGRYIPIIYLLYSWGSRFGVPSRVPLHLSGLQGECLQLLTGIPRYFYEREIGHMMNMCMLLDVDLCGNLVHRHYAKQGDELKSWIASMLEEGTLPLFLKLSGFTQVGQLHDARSLCETIVRRFCPRLFWNFDSWNAQRLDACGQGSKEKRDGQSFVKYEASELYNGRLAVRTAAFQIFLFWIVLLWALAVVPEFVQLVAWWELLVHLPCTDSCQNCEPRDLSSSEEDSR